MYCDIRVEWLKELKRRREYPIFEYEGKTYTGKDLVLKTIDENNICSFYGFKGVSEE